MKSLEEILTAIYYLKPEAHQQFERGFNAAIDDVRKRIQSLKPVRVTGVADGEHLFGSGQHSDRSDSHEAWLICIEPLVRGVSKDEIQKKLKQASAFVNAEGYPRTAEMLKELADRIEAEGIKV